MAKATGVEIREFYDNHWPDGYYVDDYEIDAYDPDTGAWVLNDTEKYDLAQLGSLYVEDPPPGLAYYDNSMTFQTAFSRWKKAASQATLVISVGKENEQALRDFCKTIGAKIK